ncbi:hypothetical protein AKJ40_03155 [candidate division MSBL1 archaeon SCGC-AAA259M10]|uniref:Uncharacterized protein n=1 Tax=candidate division MSBL1 archaeon SCGC-AAA259M10 TaxID=1698270 RepID=A0A133UZ34_9EURY|nr:hypothetical protein AKJ40_03155 [candidate division MSBL1 archaeon SCGC-AAA259M10]
MSKFVAECPIDGCDFQVESYWEYTARGEVILHAYRAGGGGHGEKGSRPRDRDPQILRDELATFTKELALKKM